MRDNAAIIAALPLAIRETFKKALSKWEKATPYVPEDPTTLPADETLREAIIRATTAGKINLNANDGSAEFSDVVNIGSWSSSDPAFSARLGGTNNFKFRANLSAPDSKIVDFHNNGSTDNEVVASISASGAGNFLGGVTVGGNGATQYKGSWISDGTLRIGGTLPASPNIELNASDGSATFAGKVTAADYNLEALPSLP